MKLLRVLPKYMVDAGYELNEDEDFVTVHFNDTLLMTFIARQIERATIIKAIKKHHASLTKFPPHGRV